MYVRKKSTDSDNAEKSLVTAEAWTNHNAVHLGQELRDLLHSITVISASVATHTQTHN